MNIQEEIANVKNARQFTQDSSVVDLCNVVLRMLEAQQDRQGKTEDKEWQRIGGRIVPMPEDEQAKSVIVEEDQLANALNAASLAGQMENNQSLEFAARYLLKHFDIRRKA